MIIFFCLHRLFFKLSATSNFDDQDTFLFIPIFMGLIAPMAFQDAAVSHAQVTFGPHRSLGAPPRWPVTDAHNCRRPWLECSSSLQIKKKKMSSQNEYFKKGSYQGLGIFLC